MSALPTPTPASTPTPTLAPTERVTQRIVDVGHGLGLVTDVPVGWSLDGLRGVNRGTQRLILASNIDVATLPTIPGNGDIDAAALPGGAVTVEIESFCRLICTGPTEETSLPLDWSNAGPLAQRSLPDGRHELAVGFRWFGRPMFVVARWADDAPPADIASIATITARIRADPPLPAAGEYRGWDGVGPLSDIPPGTVRLEALPVGAVIRSPGRLFDNGPFFIVRAPEGVTAFPQRPLQDRRCAVAFDANSDRFTCTVDGRVFAWTRRGTYLGPDPASDMRPLTVVVRDGLVWVDYAD